LKHEYREALDLRVGAYSPLGFKDSEPQRWEILVEGAHRADFIAGLPERDDQADYPDHIGFEASCGRLVTLSQQLRKPLHLHIDQKNLADENGAECAVRVIDDLRLTTHTIDDEPSIWFVHMISSSAFQESRFQNLLESLVEYHLGVICCPSAAISMRQIRASSAPTHNSIARVLDMLAAGVPVRLGSDNICDITSPAGTTDLVDELFVLCNAIRFYDESILAKLAAGVVLNSEERHRIQNHLKSDAFEMHRVIQQYQLPRKAA
jgi:cytosine/adenosine deaminase-related metal-dependent hydrolase